VLTILQEKLAEAHGLAIAAEVVTEKVEGQTDGAHLIRDLGLMRLEVRETRERCLAAEQSFGAGPAAEMLAHANSTSLKGADLIGAWFKAGTDALAAWTFVAMGEAGEVAAWTAVRELSDTEAPNVRALAEWALPVQERHLQIALAAVAGLATSADPAAPRSG
jgi:hypothetical protein